MRVAAVAFVSVLAFSVPAQAAPITFQFHGIVNSISQMVSQHVATELEVGDPFLASLTFEQSSTITPVSFNLGAYAGTTVCATSCWGPLPQSRPATTILPMPGAGIGPPSPWSSHGYFVHSLFSLTLAQGWQTGSFSIWMENAYIGAPVAGTITSMNVVGQPVPEPASILLSLLGLGAAAAMRRRRAMR